MTQNAGNLVWLDLEMTGLNPTTCHIIEIATIVTDEQLNILAEGPSLAIYQPESILSTMDEWCQSQHTKSGLVERIRSSHETLESAEQKTLDFISQYVKANTSPMCGNSICQDRRFLYQWMPQLEAFFHYRNLDVSTVKELAKRWSPEIANGFSKHSSHLALEDVKDSIAELEYYRAHLFSI